MSAVFTLSVLARFVGPISVERVTFVIFKVTNVTQKVTNDTYSSSYERDIIRPYQTGENKVQRAELVL